MKKVKIGIIGCGNISGIYFKRCTEFNNIEVAACADLVQEKAEESAEKYGIPQVVTVEEMLDDPEIES